MLVILSGTAGAGKDTIKKELIKRMENIESLPSMTTREKRNGDIEGVTYYFISKEEFEELIKNEELYEFDLHHNNYYGVPKKIMNEKIADGKIILKDIDVNGTENLKKVLGKHIKIISIFLYVPKEELEKRLKERIDKPSEEEIKLRLDRYEFEQAQKDNYDYVINNVNLEETINKIIHIIQSEKKEL